MLFNLAVPALAIAGAVFEAQPAAAHSVARHPRSAHQKLAERHIARNAVGAKHKRQYQVLTRRDGSKCRVRPQSAQQSSTDTNTNAQPSAGTNTDAQPSAQSTTDTNTDAQPSAQSSAGTNTDAQPSAQSTTDTNTDAQPSAQSSTDTNTDAQPSAQPSTGNTNTPDSPGNGTETLANPANETNGGGQGAANGGSVNVGSKLGAAWPNGDWTGANQPGWIGNFVGSRTSWYYTWSPQNCKQNDDLGLEFVPMLWGAKQVSAWHAAADSWPSSVKNALFFNEPNQQGQASIDIYGALGYWTNDFLPKTRQRGLRVGSAAPTSAPDGVEWVVNFYNNCMKQNGNDNGKCKADFAPLHYYGVDASAFQTYLQQFHDKAGLPLWVTEFACQNFDGGAQCDEGQTWSFHQQMAAWMDGQDWIERYSPFGMMRNMQGVEQSNALMNSNGDVTGLGHWYISGA